MPSSALSSSGLARLHRVLSAHVGHSVPGLVALVSHRDHVHVEALGTLAFDGAAPMQRDTIFRAGSIVKPVTAAAAMLLVEDCRLRLDDPVDTWLPELANRRVLRTLASSLDDTVPAQRAITLRDLLTSRMGFGSVMAMPGTYPIQHAIRDLRIGGDGHLKPSLLPREAEWIANLGSLPLVAQPGERWLYHTSIDVLGVLVSRVAGQPFGRFLRERLFDPLGMKDAGFHVPADQLHRLPPCYAFDHASNAFVVFDDTPDTAWSPEPPFESGAGGLVCTVDDCHAFCRLLLNHGRHGNAQILSRASVALMTTDQLTPENRIGAGPFFGDHSSWGFGMAVGTRRTDIYQTPGRYGWDGGYGVSAYTDPVEGLIGILFTQCLLDSPVAPKTFSDFWTAAYAALE